MWFNELKMTMHLLFGCHRDGTMYTLVVMATHHDVVVAIATHIGCHCSLHTELMRFMTVTDLSSIPVSSSWFIVGWNTET